MARVKNSNLPDFSNLSSEREKEDKALEYFIGKIEENIDYYIEYSSEVNAETKLLYDNYRSNNPELHNELVTSLNWKKQVEATLGKNLKALAKPYFGRIDYLDIDDKEIYSLYIGKNGIFISVSEMLIIDWRAPVASIYYDNEIGKGSYKLPDNSYADIELYLKRTFEIEQKKLIDYYDTDIIASDEFITKYLSNNKEVILGEIIATIQKEQNTIIRDTPWHSVIVQGVAGSGKTTVAMHRISYILYNYGETFHESEFYVIGSNKMLLNYITGVLPNLDVHSINQMVLEEFLLDLLDKDFDIKKKKYILNNNYIKTQAESTSTYKALMKLKGSLKFIYALESYITQYELNTIPTEAIIYKGKELYSKENILETINAFGHISMQQKIDLLNNRLTQRIKTINEINSETNEYIKSEVKKYKNYFGDKKSRIDIIGLYMYFLIDLESKIKSGNNDDSIDLDAIQLLIKEYSLRKIDVYDLCMMSLIKKRIKSTDSFDYAKHIVIDEAQDFGVSIFLVLKKLHPDCTFTIMGDVSQNIYYDIGMNDWEELKNNVFTPEKDKFYTLAKSYRNTVEISNFAGSILQKASFKTYEIEPIIRHGIPVGIFSEATEKDMLNRTIDIINNLKSQNYNTISVICHSIEETKKVQKMLNKHMDIINDDLDTVSFEEGVMVLPIHLTKGLEFDGVVLWNPNNLNYNYNDANAKLLYVATTRALHELNVVYTGDLCGLLVAN